MTQSPPEPHDDPPGPPGGADAQADPQAGVRWGVRVRFAAWVTAVVVLAAGLPVWIWGLRGGRILESPAWLAAGWLGASAVLLGIWSLLATTPPDATRLSPRLGKRIVLGASVPLAGLAVVLLAPVLSAEPLRYRFDGKLWLLGVSPYATSPAEAQLLSDLRGDPDLRPDLLDQVGGGAGRLTGGLTSLNGPTSQAVFVAARAVEYLTPPGPDAGPLRHPFVVPGGDDWRQAVLELPPWRRMLAWRAMLGAALLLTVGELVAWLRSRGHSVWWVLTFAWQPVVLVQGLGMGHQDVLGVLFLVAGLRRIESGRYRRGAMCLAAAAAVKPLALVALPFVLRGAWKAGGWPQVRRTAAWFVAVAVLLTVPALGAGSGWRHLGPAFLDFLRYADQNPAVQPLLQWTFGGDGGRTVRLQWAGWTIAVVLATLTGVVAWYRSARPAAATYGVLAAGLLFAPAAPPWVLLWPLAMVPVLGGRGGLTMLVWAGTCLFYPPAGRHDDPAAWAWQIVPVLLAAAAEAVAAWRHRP